MSESHKTGYGMRAEASHYPMMLVLSFVFPCNAKCPHCPYSNSDIRQSYRDTPYMPAELFRKIADETGQHKAMLRISGGGRTHAPPASSGTSHLCQAGGVQGGVDQQRFPL
ncbi:MAG: hypothetical protein G8345_20865 [Magnetococcales bacterium]|nr:hypothetical protein [Magnetococcales bacterium]